MKILSEKHVYNQLCLALVKFLPRFCESAIRDDTLELLNELELRFQLARITASLATPAALV